MNNTNSEENKDSKRKYIVLIVTSAFFITYLHYTTIPGLYELHSIFSELYYIPLLIGALAFGLRGSIVTFIFVSILYVPHVLISWTGTFISVANQISHAVFTGAVALLAGLLVDRERRHREHAEKARYLAGLGQAAAAIVHDLKNPLISILGFARRIKQGKGNIEEASETIITSAEDMELIVHDVLGFARPIKLKIEQINAGSVIDKVRNYCSEKAEHKEVALLLDMPHGSGTLQVDRSHIERALINLVNNAIEASGPGDSVDIRTEVNDSSFVIRIKDYGMGMDEETLKNIFIPFYSKKSYGTGLGTAIAKKVIEGHKGKIHIESQEQRGTEVIIELPLTS